jgi:hypothetical protein
VALIACRIESESMMVLCQKREEKEHSKTSERPWLHRLRVWRNEAKKTIDEPISTKLIALLDQ